MKKIVLFLAVMLLASVASADKPASKSYPLIWNGILADAVTADLPEGVIASSGEIKLTKKDIDAEIAKLPDYMRDEARRYPAYALEQALRDKLITAEAQAWAKRNPKQTYRPDMVSEYLSDMSPKPRVTDKDALDFYTRDPSIFGNAPFESVKETIKAVLVQEKAAMAREGFKNAIGKRMKIQVSAPWLKAEYEKWIKNPVEIARASKKPTIAIISVDGCCEKLMSPMSKALTQKYGDKLRVVFIDIRNERVLSELHGVTSMPAEILYDSSGKEFFRNQGSLTVDELVAEFGKQGIKL